MEANLKLCSDKGKCQILVKWQVKLTLKTLYYIKQHGYLYLVRATLVEWLVSQINLG